MKEDKLMAHDPLSDADSILTEEYYGKRVATGAAPAGAPKVAKAQQRPTHYKVICISLYNGDLERLDKLVDELKARGLTKANRSALIRAALDQVDLAKVPRGL